MSTVDRRASEPDVKQHAPESGDAAVSMSAPPSSVDEILSAPAAPRMVAEAIAGATAGIVAGAAAGAPTLTALAGAAESATLPEFSITMSTAGCVLRWPREAELAIGVSALDAVGHPLAALLEGGEDLVPRLAAAEPGAGIIQGRFLTSVEGGLACELIASPVVDRRGVRYVELGVYLRDPLPAGEQSSGGVTFAGGGRDRLAFLAEASTLLSSSLNYHTTLGNVARMLVPELADWCGVDMVADDGGLVRLAIAHADPEKVALAEEIQRTPPREADGAVGVAAVIRTGKAEFHPVVTDEVLNRLSRNEEMIEIARRLGISSMIIVPIVARDRVLGAITLAHAESGRRYTEADLSLAEELAGRAAIAVDNALLFRDAELARIEAENASRAKDQFLAVLSHELRTPLSPILISAQALETDAALPDHLRPLLEIVRRNIELEARLIDDLLDLTRITRGRLKIEREQVDLHALVDLAIGIMRPELEAKGLTLDRNLRAGDHTVIGDAARLEQVMLNMIRNAVKFTSAGGSIRISTVNDAPGHIRLAVADSGVGIDSDALTRIFEAFEQGEKTTLRRFGGLGLGLTICKALIDMHDGTITAESAGRNHGATFTIGLNTTSAHGTDLMTNTAGNSATGPNGALRILLVDDHEDTNMVLKLLLQRKGYHVLTAHDVQSALDVAAANEFDVLVSDIGLPDGSGLELMRKLLERYPIKGIALSGFGMEEDIRRSKEAGFSDHLVKPVNPQRLQEVIQQVVA